MWGTAVEAELWIRPQFPPTIFLLFPPNLPHFLFHLFTMEHIIRLVIAMSRAATLSPLQNIVLRQSYCPEQRVDNYAFDHDWPDPKWSTSFSLIWGLLWPGRLPGQASPGRGESWQAGSSALSWAHGLCHSTVWTHRGGVITLQAPGAVWP